MVFAPPRPDEVLKKFEIVRIDTPPLVDLLDERHELVKLANVIDWPAFDRQFGSLFKRELGREPIETRKIVAVLYLKHTYNLSDEEVIARIRENVYWQHFKRIHSKRSIFQSRPDAPPGASSQLTQTMDSPGIFRRSGLCPTTRQVSG